MKRRRGTKTTVARAGTRGPWRRDTSLEGLLALAVVLWGCLFWGGDGRGAGPNRAAEEPIRLLVRADDKHEGALDIYWTDVEGGAATLIVTPAGESILIDTGNPGERDSGRIHKTVTEVAGLERIDYLIVTHFDGDHYGGTADLAKLLPIGKVYDPGLPRDNPRVMRRLGAYLKATEGKRTVLRPGDRLPLKLTGKTPLSLECLAAGQKFVAATAAQRKPNRFCAEHEPQAKDLSQNANSTVLVLRFGAFDFLDAADLTWNLEQRLVCPDNLVGTVDVYQSDHHGLDRSNNPVLIRSVAPTVAIINNAARKGCEPNTFKALKETESVTAIYQVHRNVRVGPEGNTEPHRIANMDAKCTAEIIKLSVDPSAKRYTVTIPAKGTKEEFRSK